MNKKLKQQKGAIIIMTIFLMFIYLAFAALFVDGFRLYETKQQIDSYTQYVTESLKKRLVEDYNACCNEEYEECIASGKEDCEAEGCTCTDSTQPVNDKIYKKLIGDNTVDTKKINKVIKITPRTVNCINVDKSVKCEFEMEVPSNNFIFAGIFASKFFGNGGLASEFTINVCLKSCYNKALEDNHIYPYYFRACNRNC